MHLYQANSAIIKLKSVVVLIQFSSTTVKFINCAKIVHTYYINCVFAQIQVRVSALTNFRALHCTLNK